MADPAEVLFDRAVAHQIGLQRYSTTTVRRILSLLGDVELNIIAEIARLDPDEVSSGWAARRRAALLDAIREIIAEGYKTVNGTIRDEVRALAVYEVDFQARMIGEAKAVALDTIKPSRQQLYAAVNSRPFQGRLLKDNLADLPKATARLARGTIAQGFAEGQTTQDIIRALRGTRAESYKNGVLQRSRRSIETTVRTALNHTATTAREELYKENPRIIRAVQLISVLDGKTSARCRALDLTEWPVNKGPRSPHHPNCRGTSVALLVGQEGDDPGTRASKDGQVDGNLSYGEWLHKQPAEFQDDVLGKTKGKLFRKGGLTVDKFVEPKMGREYSLAELRRREEDAFSRSGL